MLSRVRVLHTALASPIERLWTHVPIALLESVLVGLGMYRACLTGADVCVCVCVCSIDERGSTGHGRRLSIGDNGVDEKCTLVIV